MRLIRLILFSVILLLMISRINALSLDMECPIDFPRYINGDKSLVSIKPIGSNQELVKVRLLKNFNGHDLTSVFVTVGAWRYDNDGKLLSSPIIEMKLQINNTGKEFFTTFVKSSSIDDIEVSIDYGDGCGYILKYKL